MKIETKRQRIIAVTFGVVIVVLAICLFMLPRGNRVEAYRSIRIVELEGTVTIEREGIGNLAAAVNMNLMSGDRVSTEEGAYIVLRLDTDKYVMLGENGVMKVIAEGSESADRTSIHLTAGSVLSEIRNPLGKDDAFDIVTPNAAMSVRGTVFEVRRTEEDGKGKIAVLVYNGKVAVEPVGEESALYEAGEYTEFTDDEAPKFLTEREIITEEQMDNQMLWRLQQIVADGRGINLGTVQISEANVKTPIPEPTMVPEVVSIPEVEPTPEAVATAEPTIAPTVTSTPRPAIVPVVTPTPKPATGAVTAGRPGATATPVPEMATTKPDDTNDWDSEDDTEPEDTMNSEPMQTMAPTLTAEPSEEPQQSTEPAPGVEPDQTSEPVSSTEPTEEPGSESQPTEEPTPEPQPTEEPTPEPQPTEEPTPELPPTEEPTPEPGPTEEPAPDPIEESSSEPELTEEPISEPGEETTSELDEGEEPPANS